MKNIDLIQLNKISSVHNHKNIFFCKTDYILQDFDYISKLDNDVVLITGNSDYAITEELFHRKPKNITSWYCQNAIFNHDIIHPIPIGLENKYPSYRHNHGIGYLQRATEKENIINNIQQINPSKLIYANFTINTNINHRQYLTNIIKKLSYITYRNSTLSLKQFFDDIADHKMVLCPIGNGIDTHRLWETLYCDRIPIVFKVGNYKIYELYEQFPIIILDSFSQLLDEEYMINRYNQMITKIFDNNLLNCEYWKQIILNHNHA